MVIHEESESPVEIAVIRKPEILEPKKYVMINNHIREFLINNEDSPSDNPASDQLIENEGNKKRGKSSSNKSKKRKTESEENPKFTQISESDLLELRTVYQNCLSVIGKIEAKYGHLLNIEAPCHSRLQHGYNYNQDQRYTEACHCTKNKKIVFDDDGQQHTLEIEDHICPPMPKKYVKPAEKCSVTTDSEDYNLSLPDDLPSLCKLLQDPQLSHRNKVIDKIKSIKQDHMNELRFNRPALIQAVKRDPDEVLGFSGVNFGLLPGYL